jgi:hypothetical protein
MADTGQVDVKRLWEMAKSGMPADEIMKHFNISDKNQLKNIMMEVTREKGESVYIKGLIDHPSISAQYTQDGIRISPAMLEDCIFREGDYFDFKVEGDKITLQKTDKITSEKSKDKI